MQASFDITKYLLDALEPHLIKDVSNIVLDYALLENEEGFLLMDEKYGEWKDDGYDYIQRSFYERGKIRYLFRRSAYDCNTLMFFLGDKQVFVTKYNNITLCGYFRTPESFTIYRSRNNIDVSEDIHDMNEYIEHVFIEVVDEHVHLPTIHISIKDNKCQWAKLAKDRMDYLYEREYETETELGRKAKFERRMFYWDNQLLIKFIQGFWHYYNTNNEAVTSLVPSSKVAYDDEFRDWGYLHDKRARYRRLTKHDTPDIEQNIENYTESVRACFHIQIFNLDIYDRISKADFSDNSDIIELMAQTCFFLSTPSLIMPPQIKNEDLLYPFIFPHIKDTYISSLHGSIDSLLKSNILTEAVINKKNIIARYYKEKGIISDISLDDLNKYNSFDQSIRDISTRYYNEQEEKKQEIIKKKHRFKPQMPIPRVNQLTIYG